MWLCQSIADLKLLERRRQARITERRRERKKKDSGRSPSVTNNERTCLSDMLKSINSLLVRGCFYPDWCGPEKMLRICARKSHLACCRSGFGGQRAVQLGFDRVNGGTTGRGGGDWVNKIGRSWCGCAQFRDGRTWVPRFFLFTGTLLYPCTVCHSSRKSCSPPNP